MDAKWSPWCWLGRGWCAEGGISRERLGVGRGWRADPPWGTAASVPGGVPRRGKDGAVPHGGKRFVQFRSLSPCPPGKLSHGGLPVGCKPAQRLRSTEIGPGAGTGTNGDALRELTGAAQWQGSLAASPACGISTGRGAQVVSPQSPVLRAGNSEHRLTRLRQGKRPSSPLASTTPGTFEVGHSRTHQYAAAALCQCR